MGKMAEINVKFNNQITSPQFRAGQNMSKPAETENKKGLSTGAKWAIGTGLTALAAYGIYAITKGKAKPKNKPITPPTTPQITDKPAAEIKELNINEFKKLGKFDKGNAFLEGDKKYTGNIISESKDGSKVVMEYVDGVLQKSTKTSKDGTKIFGKAYTWAEDGLIKEVKKNGETVLDENKLIEIYKKANLKLSEKDTLSGNYPEVIKNLEEIYADLPKVEDAGFKDLAFKKLRILCNSHGCNFSNDGKIIYTKNLETEVKNGLGDLRKQNEELITHIKEPIEKKYLNLLIFSQDLDSLCDDAINDKVAQKIKKSVETTLAKLRYKFEDFGTKTKDLYDIEYDHALKDIELVRRAIVDKNGNEILKGKVYAPENFS